MARGFTLLEMLITMAVLLVLLGVSTPNFSTITAQTKMTQLADSLQAFMHQAKSEAVFRNQDLWAHIEMPSNPDTTGGWKISLTDSISAGSGTLFMTFLGKPYGNISVTSVFSSDQIKFDGIRGKVKNGSFSFYPVGQSNQSLKLKSSYGASRVMVCGVTGETYGYPDCD